MKKILICGFPHCGTTILKSIIGHCEDVLEIVDETMRINNKSSDKPFIICKWPFTEDVFFNKSYEDYIKIFIIRNPLYVFSSLNKRFEYNIAKGHSIDIYINTAKMFINNKNTKNVFTIKYEDIFENNYQKLRDILDTIGINYTDDIFNNSKYKNIAHNGTILVDSKPTNYGIYNHIKYRTWQINQPFISNNDNSTIDLTNIQMEKIINNETILQIYPDLNIS
jgi:hypothetical protein